jgi:hypothetical protein
MSIDVVNKWLSAGASIAVIIGVAGAIIGAVVATQRARLGKVRLIFQKFSVSECLCDTASRCAKLPAATT